ncbi:aspartate aminotransferase family protein [Cyanobium sp. N.Huapi 1H5]|uniref:pyridoxal phosphate-dependent decarboxylase family protein n=1 Tax=Cyanobium sp. N.Huapi 1H5 TaxID=2823719 RepID=UPI0020CD8C39|nr:aminotransferase class V-fold PLP-dependent enzyme [Cyanobium sp. N.Huapi 1H5]MCP9836919.1 aspartate aminotransferase family protein [Cyanobium sp. N.Huapi 1H5]
MASVPPAQRPAPPPRERDSFVDPFAADPALEAFLHQASTLLCRWLGQAGHGTPLPGLSVLPVVEPEAQGLDSDRLLADLQLVMEGAYNPNHPGALAHLDPPPLSASIVADLICAGLNNNLLAEELSPSLSRLERALCAWMAGCLGLPGGSGGVAASGGSLSNLMALVTARHQRGLATRGDAVVLCSEEAHVSLIKAVAVMGLPAEALVRLPVTAAGALDPLALEERLARLDRAGTPVIAVVATSGTTVRGAIDPLEPIAALCRGYGHWLHVDGAIGAIFAFSERLRPLLGGLGLADSITVNPQKLLGITKTSSLLLLADPRHLQRAFNTGLPYMEPSWGGGHQGEAGLQGTRPGEILKLWLGLRQLGLEGMAALIDAAVQRRSELERQLRAIGGLSLCSGPLHLLAFRPEGCDAAGAERWSAATRAALLGEQLMLSRPVYRGLHHLKAVLGNPHTGREHLERLALVVQRSLAEAADG